ncbi:MAG: M24 family metallopeptidase [Bdellovibrionaceae bacterium]|nr:M24 family metallopeptidase [Pseudobdellovibrionaceae bacterium]MBX3034599.1 M24 family metallopeptidase [Pseudobdellovibrionaceae bacterium]
MDHGLISPVKNAQEIALLREAARWSAEAHRELMWQAPQGATEKGIAAQLEGFLRQRGSSDTAYPTIVGAGERALILHAEPTERRAVDGELVLVDAGGKAGGYCADITRTWPAGDRFSDKQRILYEVVLRAQKSAIRAVRPGVTLLDLHEGVKRDLLEGLRRQNWLKRGEEDRLREFYPHKTSHWLGRLVHDPCAQTNAAGEPLRLEPGMVFTIEPGLYFEGLGVRIEDDILVTDTGCEVLSSAAPKEVEEVQEARAAARRRSSKSR